MANPIKKLMGQTAMYGLPSILVRFLNYLLTPIITRAFLPEEFGVVAEMYAYVGLLTVLLTYGMETGYFRFASKHENPKIVFTTSIVPLFISSTFFVLIFYLFSQQLADFLHYPDKSEYIVWFSLILAADAIVSIPFAKLRIEGKAKKFAFFKFVNILVNIFVTIFFVVICKNNENTELNLFHINSFSFLYQPQIGVGYIFIANLAASLVTLLMFIPDFFKIKFILDKKLLKQILFYSFPLLFAGLAGMINEVADRILLKYFTVVPLGVENPEIFIRSQIGIYNANYKLAILMTLFIQAFRYAAEPFFFSQKNDVGVNKVYADVMKYFVIFGLVIFLGVMLYIDIAKYFIADNYREGLIIVPILLIANLFLGIIYNLSIWYKLTDKTQYGAYLAVFGAIVTIVLNIILIPIFGYLGAAWATFACYFLMMIASFVLGQKYFHINYETKRILLYFSAALAVYFASIFIAFDSQFLVLLIKTGLLIAFVSWVSYRENIHLMIKKIILKKK